MKKLIITLIAVSAAAISANAQFIVTAGYDHPTCVQKVKISNKTTTTKNPANSFYVQGGYILGLADNFDIQASLGLEYGASKYETEVLGANASAKAIDLSLILPVNASYKFDLGSNIKLGVFAGPEFEYSLVGKLKTKVGDKVTKTDVLDDDAVRFGVFADAGAFVEFSEKIRIIADVYQSLTNYTKVDNCSERYRGFSIGVAYLF